MNAPVLSRTVAAEAMAHPSRDLADMVRRLSSSLEATASFRRKAISSAAAPTASERETLSTREIMIGAWLRPGEAADIARAASVLRSVLPSSGGGEASVKLSLQAYAMALDKYPQWAVDEACRRFVSGDAPNDGYAPSPPKLADECRRIVEPLRVEAGVIRQILDAEVYQEPTEAQKTRARKAVRFEASFDRVLAGMKKHLPVGQSCGHAEWATHPANPREPDPAGPGAPPPISRDKAFLDDCLASGGLLQGVTLSPDLAETFNKDGKR